MQFLLPIILLIGLRIFLLRIGLFTYFQSRLQAKPILKKGDRNMVQPYAAYECIKYCFAICLLDTVSPVADIIAAGVTGIPHIGT